MKKNLARFVELELKHEGYETEVHFNGRTGLEAALAEDWDAILLDLMLPELNGLEVCRRVRQVKNTPIIMMTARDSVIDRVSGLDHGADDYIVKPFAIEELLARLRALLRRISIEGENNTAKQTTIKYRDLVIEKENRVVRRGDDIIELTKREYELLLTLMENVNVVLARVTFCSQRFGVTTLTWKRMLLTSMSVIFVIKSIDRVNRVIFKRFGNRLCYAFVMIPKETNA